MFSSRRSRVALLPLSWAVAIRRMEVSVGGLLVDWGLRIIILLDRAHRIAGPHTKRAYPAIRCIRRNSRVSPPWHPLRVPISGRTSAGSHAAGSHAAGSHAAGSHAAGSHATGSHATGSRTSSAVLPIARVPRALIPWPLIPIALIPWAGCTPWIDPHAADSDLRQLRSPGSVGDGKGSIGIPPLAVGSHLGAPLFRDVIMIGVESDLQTAARVIEAAPDEIRLTAGFGCHALRILINPIAGVVMRVFRRHGGPIHRGSCRRVRGSGGRARKVAWFARGLTERTRSEEGRCDDGSGDTPEIDLWKRKVVAHSSQTNWRPENFYQNPRFGPLRPGGSTGCDGYAVSYVPRRLPNQWI